MKPIALIIEDDPAIREALADRLESLGHDYHPVGSQSEARERLKRCTYDYVLLDLEVPTRIGRPPAISTGKNILSEIRQDPKHSEVPVLVVTAHGHDSPDLAVDLMKLGATDFVKKPFESIDDSIREALGRKGPARGPNRELPELPEEAQPLAGAELTFYDSRVDLAGVEVCNSESGVIWRILSILTRTWDDGRPRGFPAKMIANELGLDRGQNAVIDAVSHFRKGSIGRMKDAGYFAENDSIIVRGTSGYQINSDLVVRNRAPQPNERRPDDESLAGEERQAWILDQLAQGTKLRRIDIERHFRKSSATVKRDLGAIAGQIEFRGSGPAGYYAVRESVARRT